MQAYKIPKYNGYSSFNAEKPIEVNYKNNFAYEEYKPREIMVEPKRIEINNIKFQTISHPRSNYRQENDMDTSSVIKEQKFYPLVHQTAVH